MSKGEIFGGVCALALAVPASANEIIGRWDIAAAPSSASLLRGGGVFFDWLNVDKTPIDVNEAFSGFPIVDDGFGNAAKDTMIEVTFDAGVVNSDGPDLVFFEARFITDEGLYAITVDGSNEVLYIGDDPDQPVPFPVRFEDTDDERDYFYGFNGTMDTADIFGAEIDLSYFGIPVGQLVEPLTLQFEVLTDFRAPLGFGALVVPTPGTFALLAVGAIVAVPRRRR